MLIILVGDTMKKILLTIMSIFLLSACSLSNNPSSKVEAYLNQYNNLSDNVKLDLESKVASENLSDKNKKVYKDLLTKQYKNMKYEIKDKTINADEATVKAKITVIDYFKAQKESDDYLKENPSKFYDENQIFSDELFNTYKLKKMDEVKDTVDYDITFKLNKVDGQWKLESPDRIILEKIHGLYDYTSDN